MRVRVDSSSFATQSTGNVSFTADTMESGVDTVTHTIFYTGQVAELITANTVLSDADLDNIKKYVSARYGLSL